MRVLAGVGLIAAVAVGGCKAVERAGRARVDDAGPELPAAPVAPSAAPAPGAPAVLAPGRYLVRAVGVAAQPKKRSGMPWDVGSPPDLRLTVTLDGQVVGTCDGPEDAVLARCDLALEVELDALTHLAIAVSDRDLRDDDHVGDARADELLTDGRADGRIALTTTGQLASAYVELVPAPTTLARFRDRLLALGLGVVAGLALVFGLRRRLVQVVELPIGPDDEWRCRYCKATNVGPVLACHKCGGAR